MGEMAEYYLAQAEQEAWDMAFDFDSALSHLPVIPAGAIVRAARMKAHMAFDRLWKQGLMTRGEAYTELADFLELSREECHMGRMMDLDVLNEVVMWADELLGIPLAAEDFPDDL